MSKGIALIPARGGSKRVPGKNTKLLAGHPLLAYTICAALDSGCFEKVLVSSDDTATLDIATRYGADCLRRPDEFATDTSPDIEWLAHALTVEPSYSVAAILRPTSPFRGVAAIQHAMNVWNQRGEYYDSMRMVTPCGEHPAKQWRIIGEMLIPVLMQPEPQPWHSSQKSTLPAVYSQTGGMEVMWTEMVRRTNTIAGERILPYIVDGEEAQDINVEADWLAVEQMIHDGVATLPSVREKEAV